MMAVGDDIRIARQGRAGRITLTRSHVLNALTYEMIIAIEQALLEWRDDPAISLIIVDAEGDRAFCAGGDIGELYKTGSAGNFDYGRRFWSDEYRVNALIAEYPKPYVAFMQGLVMGGGVGISCHGSHRIVGDTSRIAMPECGIGLVPDVGGSFLLARAPGRLGEYLAMTGTRMKPADAIYCGFADCLVPEQQWDDLKDLLCAEGNIEAIKLMTKSGGPSDLATIQPQTDKIFCHPSAYGCVKALEKHQSDNQYDSWASDALNSIRRGCPLSLACAVELVRMARDVKTVREALALELRFTWRSMSQGEFIEGVRAQIIDKDRNPKWKIAMLEDVTRQQIKSMLKPLDQGQQDKLHLAAAGRTGE